MNNKISKYQGKNRIPIQITQILITLTSTVIKSVICLMVIFLVKLLLKNQIYNRLLSLLKYNHYLSFPLVF